jgi:ribokinase
VSGSESVDPDAFDVVVVGSANLDLVVRAPRVPGPGETLIGDAYDEYPGGKGLNQAVAAARSGARVAFVSAFGDDEAGDRLRTVATEDGIDTTFTPALAGTTTGRALITVADDGENTIVVVPGANAMVTSDASPPGAVVLAQLEIPVEAVIASFVDARRRGATTILNPAPATTLPPELLAVTDVVVPNEHEILLIGGVGALLGAGVSTVIVTMGASGVEVTTAYDGTAVTTRHAAIQVDAIDTTGAGDAFCGALAARLAAGDSMDDAIGWAIRAGGLATTRRGAVPSLPTSDEIVARLSAEA